MHANFLKKQAMEEKKDFENIRKLEVVHSQDESSQNNSSFDKELDKLPDKEPESEK